MRMMMQLTPDRSKAHWKWEWDEEHSLAEMFTLEIAALMVDVTDMKPEPQEGWLYDGQNFTAPVHVMESPQPCCMTLTTIDGTKAKKVFLNDTLNGFIYEDVE